MTASLEVETAVLRALEACAAARPKRGRCAQGAALLRPIARGRKQTPDALAAALEGHAVFTVREVETTRLFGLFRRTRRAAGVSLRASGAIARALLEGAVPPSHAALLVKCVAALASVEREEEAAPRDFDGVLPAACPAPRALSPLALVGSERVEASAEGAGADASRAKAVLARLGKFAPGPGFEFSDRLRVNAPMAALEAILQSPPELLASATATEEFERWLREDCREQELGDLVTATRLRAAVERLDPPAAKRFFIRLLSFSPLREAVASAVVPLFVGRLTTAPEREAVEIVAVLEGLGTEAVVETLIRAVYEVAPDARPRVIQAIGAVGSPRVLDPLEHLALHSQVKADRVEAAQAVLRIAQRFPGPRARKAVERLHESQEAEVRALLSAAEAGRK